MIFISYRHSDAALARALQTALEPRFGSAAVSRDVKVSPASGNLLDIVTNLVADATTVLLLVGTESFPPAPSTRADASGDRDWIRFEVSLALAWNKEIVPILLDGATMPARSTLPTDIAAISDLLALRLRDSDWESDLDRLLVRLGGVPLPAPESPNVSPSIRDAGPVAGGNVVIQGENVAGRDYFG